MPALAVATATKDRSRIPAWHLVRPDDPGRTFCSRAVVALLGRTVSNLIGEDLLCRTCAHSPSRVVPAVIGDAGSAVEQMKPMDLSVD